MGLTKVFVGNLSFKTNDADLASEFSSAGKVVSANIITRGPRSLGYGFVELESEEDAQKAVQLMNKKLIDSREINVEIAKPRDELKAASEAEGGRRGRGGRGGGRGRGRGGRGGAGLENAGGDRGGGRGGRRYRSRNNSIEPGAGGAEEGAEGETGARSPPPRGRGGRGGRGGGRGGRGRGARGGANSGRADNSSRSPSTTTLFVSNLPFSVDDAGLLDLFKTHSAKEAHIVKNATGRSKGFGFVEFSTEESQKAALTATDNILTVERRTLLVKIALTDNNAAAGADAAPQENKEEKTA